MTKLVMDTWNWIQVHDLPNWIAMLISVIAWPLIVILWQHRRTNGVPGLEVHFFAGKIKIGGKEYSAVDVQFTNHTGAVTYVSNVRVRSLTEAFWVPPDAARDINQNSYHLKFIDDAGGFTRREATLQTSGSAKTCMPSGIMPLEFYQYSPRAIRRWFRRPKYFVLEYTVMVGTSRHLVATLY
ncbi:MAG: hypothetical protein JSR67_11085 [Proteobacteria bacterium]|nr:hypothetical protein [Pseudomonadota bacterium]